MARVFNLILQRRQKQMEFCELEASSGLQRVPGQSGWHSENLSQRLKPTNQTKTLLGLVKWLNSKEDSLLLQRTQVQFPASTWLTTICNSSSKGTISLFWPPRALHDQGVHTCRQTTHIKINGKSKQKDKDLRVLRKDVTTKIIHSWNYRPLINYVIALLGWTHTL